jgi:hypothetical protein
VQLVAKHISGYTNKLIQPLTLNHNLQPMLSQKFGLDAADEGLTAEQEEKMMNTGWRHRSATGHTKPDFSGQPIVDTKPAAQPQLPPLKFDGEPGLDAADPDEFSLAAMMCEVKRIYALQPEPLWFLTDDDGEPETIAQYSDTHLGSSEPSAADYKLFVNVSFVGYGNEQNLLAHANLEPGEMRDAWDSKYMKRAQAALKDRIKRDRSYLRNKVKALARFAGVLGLVKELMRNHQKQTPAQRASKKWTGTTPGAWRLWIATIASTRQPTQPSSQRPTSVSRASRRLPSLHPPSTCRCQRQSSR